MDLFNILSGNPDTAEQQPADLNTGNGTLVFVPCTPHGDIIRNRIIFWLQVFALLLTIAVLLRNLKKG